MLRASIRWPECCFCQPLVMRSHTELVLCLLALESTPVDPRDSQVRLVGLVICHLDAAVGKPLMMGRGVLLCQGRTPLMAACTSPGYPSVAEVLLRHKADVRVVDTVS